MKTTNEKLLEGGTLNGFTKPQITIKINIQKIINKIKKWKG